MKSVINNFYSKYKYFLLIFLVCIVIFWKFFFQGLIPLPADTIVGMYHPWRDYYAKEYPNGIPFNNPLITDPVRQQFIWKKLVSDSFKSDKWPIENPYSFSGTLLLANFQSGAFYPLNFLFFIFSFNMAWGMYIFLQFVLGVIFMFAYLRNLLCNADKQEHCFAVAFFGSMAWILSGFWISWAEWGNILHTALWLPLILLAIDRIIKCGLQSRPFAAKNVIFWSLVYLFSLVFSFFAREITLPYSRLNNGS